ncbi:MAG: exo-alpha-sialidase [Planctomycetes bacterium]|nr:exo-alpha-sialidase [Planctomycetota bacterium]
MSERYIAVDNVCAWPNLTLLPNGDILATIFNQPTHGGWEGDVECWASEDGGRLWNLRSVPAPHEPGTNRMNVAAGLASDGNPVVLASGWSERRPPGSYSSPHDGEILPMWVCRSEDGGHNWQRGTPVDPPAEDVGGIIPFGDIVVLGDDLLGVCIYSALPDDDHAAYFYTSEDDGYSWEVQGVIRDHDANESTPLVLPDGDILVAARTREDAHLELFGSEDQGKNWDDRGALTLPGQHPGHLLLLEEDRLLLTFGIRNEGLYGVGARFSDDMGQTWSRPRVLVNLTRKREKQTESDGPWYERRQDVGYPSSVQLEDGTLVTAYYCNGIDTHQRYHMGVVRWLLEK